MPRQQDEQIEYYRKQHAYMDASGSRYARRMVQLAVNSGNIRKDAKILEFGCGAGRFTVTLARQGYNITALDISPELLEKLRAKVKGRTNVRTYCGDISGFAKKNKGTYDYVIGFHVLHHIRDLLPVFKTILKVLKPGGQMIFLEPNPYTPLFYAQILVEKDMSWNGEKYILGTFPHKLKKILKEAGFRQISIRRFGVFPPALLSIPGMVAADIALGEIMSWNPLFIFQKIQAAKP